MSTWLHIHYYLVGHEFWSNSLLVSSLVKWSSKKEEEGERSEMGVGIWWWEKNRDPTWLPFLWDLKSLFTHYLTHQIYAGCFGYMDVVEDWSRVAGFWSFGYQPYPFSSWQICPQDPFPLWYFVRIRNRNSFYLATSTQRTVFFFFSLTTNKKIYHF